MPKKLHARDFRDLDSRAPFEELASTMLLFCVRLHSQLRELNAPEACFLAREGAMMQRLFDAFQAVMVPPCERIPTRYLWVSRRSTYAASLPGVRAENFEEICKLYPGLSAAGLVRSLGLDEEVVNEFASKADLAVSDLVASEVFQSLVRQHCLTQRRLLLSHLRSSVTEIDRVAHLVDVGWKGTMQTFIGRVLPGASEVHGWYIGLTQKGLNNERARGLLFTQSSPLSPYFSVFAHYKGLFELLLSGSHGSVVRYAEGENGPTPILEHNQIEASQHDRHIAPIQRQVEESFVQM